MRLLLLAIVLFQGSASISGRVSDASGAAMSGVHVTVSCGDYRATAVTDGAGQFRVDRLPATRCHVTAALDGFVAVQHTADLSTQSAATVDFLLAVKPFASQIVVTPARGIAEATAAIAQSATLVHRTALDSRPYTIVTQALKEEAGVLAQQTTASQGSPILRGFTGQRNLYLVDGVRYNTAAWRDGPNQYVGWLPAADVDRIEVVRGPASAQYGSDALGGTIGIFASPLIASGPPQMTGSFGLTVGSANELRASDVAAGYLRDGFSFRAGASLSAVSDLRPGDGLDSHSAVTRFLGLPSRVVGPRLENTGYTQTGMFAAARMPAGEGRHVALSYRRGDQDDSHRYDQEIGGNGRYRSEFGAERVDFGFVRFESARQSWFDEFSTTFSVNRQADGRLDEVRPGARIDRQGNTTIAYGYSAQATRSLTPRFRSLLGGEVYDEYIDGTRTLHEPNGAVVAARPDIPDNTRYTSVGIFWQQSAEIIPGRLSLRGGLRYGHFTFSSAADAAFGVPAQRIPASDTTFQASGVYVVSPDLTLTASASRGFRAANASDFGAIGLTGGGGFEISPQRAVELGGLRGSTDGANAISTGTAIGGLRPERLMAYEAGLRWHSGRLNATVNVFDLEFHDAIERRTLIFTTSVVGHDLAGYPIVRQDAAGRAFVANEARPIVTRANVTRSRVRGYEGEANLRMASSLRARVWASMARGTELETATPRRRMPPGMGGATLTWQRTGSRWWIEGTMIAATSQDRLSDGDIGDARIGASRTPASIAGFFNGTAVDRGLVRDGRLVATGETLAQVQQRLLGGAPVLAMFNETPGFVVFGARGGVRIGSRVDLTIIGENLADRNYRLHGSGVDEPGLNLVARLRTRF